MPTHNTSRNVSKNSATTTLNFKKAAPFVGICAASVLGLGLISPAWATPGSSRSAQTTPMLRSVGLAASLAADPTPDPAAQKPSYLAPNRNIVQRGGKSYVTIRGTEYDLEDKTNHFIEFAKPDDRTGTRKYLPSFNPAQAGQRFAMLCYPILSAQGPQDQEKQTYYITADGELVHADKLGDKQVKWFTKIITTGYDDVVTTKELLGDAYDEATKTFTTKAGEKIVVKDLRELNTTVYAGNMQANLPFNKCFGQQAGGFNNHSGFASSTLLTQNMNTHYRFKLAPGTTLPQGVAASLDFSVQKRDLIKNDAFADVLDRKDKKVEQTVLFPKEKGEWLAENWGKPFHEAITSNLLELYYNAPLTYNTNLGTKTYEYKLVCKFSDISPKKAELEANYKLDVTGNDIDGWTVTLSAKTVEKVDVTFEDKAGAKLATTQCEKGKTLNASFTAPATAKIGTQDVSIAFWYDKSDANQTPIDLATATFSKATTLVAKYADVSVSFENEAGTALMTTPLTIEAGSTIDGTNVPTKDGETDIEGWYVKGDATKTKVDLTTQTFVENTTLVAIKKAAPAPNPPTPNPPAPNPPAPNPPAPNPPAPNPPAPEPSPSPKPAPTPQPKPKAQPAKQTKKSVTQKRTLPKTSDALSMAAAAAFAYAGVASTALAALLKKRKK